MAPTSPAASIAAAWTSTGASPTASWSGCADAPDERPSVGRATPLGITEQTGPSRLAHAVRRPPLQRHPREAVSAPIPAPTAVRAGSTRTPVGRRLGNGHYRTLLTHAGTGAAWLDEQALTSWRGDRVEDGDGWFVYARDLDDGTFWSLGARPVHREPERYA